MTARADRASRPGRGLYPDPPRHPAPLAVQMTVAPPQPVHAPVVPVKVYTPKHATVARQVRAFRPAKTRNGGTHYTVPVVSGTGAALVEFALTLQGRPYEWGAAGPDAFDCSGLVDYVFAHFGIRLPHKAASFYGVGRAVARADIQPGDILVLDGGGHAAIALGNGLMLHAPHSGDHVRIAPIWSFSAARRVL